MGADWSPGRQEDGAQWGGGTCPAARTGVGMGDRGKGKSLFLGRSLIIPGYHVPLSSHRVQAGGTVKGRYS